MNELAGFVMKDSTFNAERDSLDYMNGYLYADIPKNFVVQLDREKRKDQPRDPKVDHAFNIAEWTDDEIVSAVDSLSGTDRRLFYKLLAEDTLGLSSPYNQESAEEIADEGESSDTDDEQSIASAGRGELMKSSDTDDEKSIASAGYGEGEFSDAGDGELIKSSDTDDRQSIASAGEGKLKFSDTDDEKSIASADEGELIKSSDTDDERSIASAGEGEFKYSDTDDQKSIASVGEGELLKSSDTDDRQSIASTGEGQLIKSSDTDDRQSIASVGEGQLIKSLDTDDERSLASAGEGKDELKSSDTDDRQSIASVGEGELIKSSDTDDRQSIASAGDGELIKSLDTDDKKSIAPAGEGELMKSSDTDDRQSIASAGGGEVMKSPDTDDERSIASAGDGKRKSSDDEKRSIAPAGDELIKSSDTDDKQSIASVGDAELMKSSDTDDRQSIASAGGSERFKSSDTDDKRSIASGGDGQLIKSSDTDDKQSIASAGEGELTKSSDTDDEQSIGDGGLIKSLDTDDEKSIASAGEGEQKSLITEDKQSISLAEDGKKKSSDDEKRSIASAGEGELIKSLDTDDEKSIASSGEGELMESSNTEHKKSIVLAEDGKRESSDDEKRSIESAGDGELMKSLDAVELDRAHRVSDAININQDSIQDGNSKHNAKNIFLETENPVEKNNLFGFSPILAPLTPNPEPTEQNFLHNTVRNFDPQNIGRPARIDETNAEEGKQSVEDFFNTPAEITASPKHSDKKTTKSYSENYIDKLFISPMIEPTVLERTNTIDVENGLNNDELLKRSLRDGYGPTYPKFGHDYYKYLLNPVKIGDSGKDVKAKRSLRVPVLPNVGNINNVLIGQVDKSKIRSNQAKSSVGKRSLNDNVVEALLKKPGAVKLLDNRHGGEEKPLPKRSLYDQVVEAILQNSAVAKIVKKRHLLRRDVDGSYDEGLQRQKIADEKKSKLADNPNLQTMNVNDGSYDQGLQMQKNAVTDEKSLKLVDNHNMQTMDLEDGSYDKALEMQKNALTTGEKRSKLVDNYNLQTRNVDNGCDGTKDLQSQEKDLAPGDDKSLYQKHENIVDTILTSQNLQTRNIDDTGEGKPNPVNTDHDDSKSKRDFSTFKAGDAFNNLLRSSNILNRYNTIKYKRNQNDQAPKTVDAKINSNFNDGLKSLPGSNDKDIKLVKRGSNKNSASAPVDDKKDSVDSKRAPDFWSLFDNPLNGSSDKRFKLNHKVDYVKDIDRILKSSCSVADEKLSERSPRQTVNLLIRDKEVNPYSLDNNVFKSSTLVGSGENEHCANLGNDTKSDNNSKVDDKSAKLNDTHKILELKKQLHENGEQLKKKILEHTCNANKAHQKFLHNALALFKPVPHNSYDDKENVSILFPSLNPGNYNEVHPDPLFAKMSKSQHFDVDDVANGLFDDFEANATDSTSTDTDTTSTSNSTSTCQSTTTTTTCQPATNSSESSESTDPLSSTKIGREAFDRIAGDVQISGPGNTVVVKEYPKLPIEDSEETVRRMIEAAFQAQLDEIREYHVRKREVEQELQKIQDLDLLSDATRMKLLNRRPDLF